jgi:hypothetical protein
MKAFIGQKLGDENSQWNWLKRQRFEHGQALDQSRTGQQVKSLLARIRHKLSRAP